MKTSFSGSEPSRGVAAGRSEGREHDSAHSALFPDLDRCTIMQHLSVLEEAGLIVAERRGRERWNHLDALPIHAIHERWIGPYAAYAASMLSRLNKALPEEVS